ncbi:MAG: ureidoglycolate hydrolase [Alphaproteobacteria bacterium]|nr:ureidoglycolate hydrolase [Alphaproteobacteria bacterium]
MTNAGTPRVVAVRPIDAQHFAPFGQVLEVPANGTRQDYAGLLSSTEPGLKPNLAVIRAEPRNMPLELKAMERHPSSSQAFMPLSATRYLVLVCPSTKDDKPDLDRLEAFECNGNQAINYNRGTWHHGMTALGAPGTFAMFMWDEGSERDTEWSKVEQPIMITTTR